MISELPLDALGYLLPAAQKWEEEEFKAEAEKRLFPLWLAERTLHQLKGGGKDSFIGYDEYINKAFGESPQQSSSTSAARTSEEILSDFLPLIEADRGRKNG